MLNQQTIEKLYAMRMRGMADAFTQQQEDPGSTQLASKSASRCWWTGSGTGVRIGAGASAADGRLQGRPASKTSTSARRRLGQADGPRAAPRLGLGAPPPTRFPVGPTGIGKTFWRGRSGKKPAVTASPPTSPRPRIVS